MLEDTPLPKPRKWPLIVGMAVPIVAVHFWLVSELGLEGLGMLLAGPGYCCLEPLRGSEIGIALALAANSALWGVAISTLISKAVERRSAAIVIVAVLSLLVAVLCLQIRANHQRLDDEAAKWQAKARAELKSDATYATARQWLRANHFFVLRDSPESQETFNFSTHGPDGDYDGVEGYLRLSENRLLGDEGWMTLDFLFNDQGQLKSIDGEALGYRVTPAIQNEMRDAGYLKTDEPQKPIK